MDQIKVQGRRFVDPLGRERIFHGLNLKDDTGEKIDWLDEEFFRRAAALGQRLLRLGLHWEYLEPNPGQYNEEILAKVDRIFDLGAKYGIYIFIDMHQDIWSSFEDGGGHGAPKWACLADGYKARAPKRVWAEGYFIDKARHRCFDHFWRNTPVRGKGLQDHYASLWQLFARRYGDHPALFGFNLFNEPFPGTPGGEIFRRLVAKFVRLCLCSPSIRRVQFLKKALNQEKHGYFMDILDANVMAKVAGTPAVLELLYQFEREHYGPFIAKITAAIREITPNGIIIFDQCYYSNFGIPSQVPLPPGESQICFDPHGYDFTVDTPAYKFASQARVGFMFGEMRKAQLGFGLPAIAGEWGGGSEDEGFLSHIEFLMDLFDSYKWSNCYFTYGQSLFNNAITQVLSRPYPVAVNGTLENFKVSPSAKSCTLWYTPSPAPLSQPTELYLPGELESVDAGEGAKFTMEGNILRVFTKSPKIVVRYS